MKQAKSKVLKYYAFGTPDSQGTVRLIRNGITGIMDNVVNLGTGMGGLFEVIFGNGSPTGSQNVSINITGWW